MPVVPLQDQKGGPDSRILECVEAGQAECIVIWVNRGKMIFPNILTQNFEKGELATFL